MAKEGNASTLETIERLATMNDTARGIDRRTLLKVPLLAAATATMAGTLSAQPTRKATFTILHTNDLHSNLIGMAPSSDYTPSAPNDDATRGGIARLATKIRERAAATQELGPVLVLDAGDFSMGTAFAAATRETGAELRLLSMIGCDATTLGNHDFTFGPAGAASAITTAVEAGQSPVVLATNSDFSAPAEALEGLQRLGSEGWVRDYMVIERDGLRFGLIGVLGREAAVYSVNAAPLTFDDPVESARAAVRMLKDVEMVDVVIALSHGGVRENPDGTITDGADILLAREIPEIDVVVGGHSHTVLQTPVIVNGRTPVVQAGHNGRFLGELTVTLDGDILTVDSARMHPIDDSIVGDSAVSEVVERIKSQVTKVVFAPRGLAIDQPLARIEGDLTNSSEDLVASTVLANLCTDAFRMATGAPIALTANGLIRNGMTQGKTGVQTVYDVFAVAPAGTGVLELTPGSTLVTGYLTGKELKNVLEFTLAGIAARPGDYFPRASGMRFTYDMTRPDLDKVTEVALGDLDRGYEPIDTTDTRTLYAVTSPLFFALLATAIPRLTNGRLEFVPKNRDGEPLESRVEAIASVAPARETPDILPQRGFSMDAADLVEANADGDPIEIKEWQAIMQFLQALPVRDGDTLPVVPTDSRASEQRFIRLDARTP
ncbi:MAG: 5'-nucleotidase C-terminal domain-containing protein [Anderseniella sp.]|nr:5'-nucleotidase C-terminal domain-containing protein [Anderseniella sp.]